jgi:protein phosphatase
MQATQNTLPDMAAAPSLAVRVFGLTDPGRVRHNNEDYFLVAELSHSPSVHLLVVADGMGGHNAGEVASALSVEVVADRLRRSVNHQADEMGILRDLQEAVCLADARLVEEGCEHPEWTGMGTTLTMAFVSGWHLFAVHAGDSRCYLFRRGELRQLTEDHTLVTELVRRGLVGPEEARRHPQRHLITNFLGGNHAAPQVDAQEVALESGDVLLLCSDGLTEMLDDGRITAILSAEEDPEAACRWLVAEANVAGGEDNVTVVVARFDAT